MSKKFSNFLMVTGLIMLVFGLSACVFKLRNQTQLPRALQVLYLQAEVPYGPFESTLRQFLLSSGVILMPTASQAPITLHLFKPIETNTSVTIGASNQTRVYVISYSVSYEFRDMTGKLLLGGQTVSTNRTLRLSANQLLETNNQLPLLEQDMRRDILNQMFYRLSSEQVLRLVSSPGIR